MKMNRSSWSPTRRTAPRWLPALCACALLGSSSGCQSKGPADVLFSFLDALNGRDRAAPLEHLSRETRESLGNAAGQLRALTKGAVDKKAHELIVFLGLKMVRDRRAVTVVSEDASRAALRVKTEAGGEVDVQVVKEDGRWRIVLPPVDPAAPVVPTAPAQPLAAPSAADAGAAVRPTP